MLLQSRRPPRRINTPTGEIYASTEKQQNLINKSISLANRRQRGFSVTALWEEPTWGPPRGQGYWKGHIERQASVFWQQGHKLWPLGPESPSLGGLHRQELNGDHRFSLIDIICYLQYLPPFLSRAGGLINRAKTVEGKSGPVVWSHSSFPKAPLYTAWRNLDK